MAFIVNSRECSDALGCWVSHVQALFPLIACPGSFGSCIVGYIPLLLFLVFVSAVSAQDWLGLASSILSSYPFPFFLFYDYQEKRMRAVFFSIETKDYDIPPVGLICAQACCGVFFLPFFTSFLYVFRLSLGKRISVDILRERASQSAVCHFMHHET